MKNVKLKQSRLETDVLIIGGGTAGCYARMRRASSATIS